MITSALVALVDPRLKLQRDVRLCWAQWNRNPRQAIAQADDVNFPLPKVAGPQDAHPVGRSLFSHQFAHFIWKHGPAPTHEIDFHDVHSGTDEAAPLVAIPATRRL